MKKDVFLNQGHAAKDQIPKTCQLRQCRFDLREPPPRMINDQRAAGDESRPGKTLEITIIKQIMKPARQNEGGDLTELFEFGKRGRRRSQRRKNDELTRRAARDGQASSEGQAQ